MSKSFHNQALPGVRITICEKVFLKNPDTSELGQKFISESIRLIDQLGFEQFTFGKLAKSIGSTEASVYRYFENKHKLLLYLAAWYWNWLEYQITLRTTNIECPEDRLDRVITLLSEPIQMDPSFAHIDEVALQGIVVRESAKAYFNKEVDQDNKEGLLESYKRLTAILAGFISSNCSSYKFPNALASTLIESSHNQAFFAEHLPRLSNVKSGSTEDLYNFLHQLVFGTLVVQATTA